GSAQWRDGGALLQHGSILVDDDQSRLGELAKESMRPVPAPATLRALMTVVPSVDVVRDALFAAVRLAEDARATALESDAELEADIRTQSARFADPAWTWRR
ncbi:MAG: hypothetical protein H0W68_09955, partial [Gemmatimonadaceae bacterium]|nr:hypothetical protein [Gemmatimonadaceae bacterium]